MARPIRLTDDEIAERLSAHPHWTYEDDGLTRNLTFESFVDAFGFMTSVALMAEKLDHHPEWSNVYNRVTIRLATHDAGGVTALDFTLAAHVDRMAP